MKIIIKKGEPLWSPEGFHILDQNGFAVVSDELHQEIHIKNPEAAERIKKCLPRERWDDIYLNILNSQEQFLKEKQEQLVLFEESFIKIDTPAPSASINVIEEFQKYKLEQKEQELQDEENSKNKK